MFEEEVPDSPGLREELEISAKRAIKFAIGVAGFVLLFILTTLLWAWIVAPLGRV